MHVCAPHKNPGTQPESAIQKLPNLKCQTFLRDLPPSEPKDLAEARAGCEGFVYGSV